MTGKKTTKIAAKSSSPWTPHFEKIGDGLYSCPQCLNKEVRSSGTSNLRAHFKVHHQERYFEICKANGIDPEQIIKTPKRTLYAVDDPKELNDLIDEDYEPRKRRNSEGFHLSVNKKVTDFFPKTSLPPSQLQAADDRSEANDLTSVLKAKGPLPPTGKQIDLGNDLVRFFIHEPRADLRLLESPLFNSLLKARVHPDFGSVEKVVTVIKARAENVQTNFKDQLSKAKWVALCFQLASSEEPGSAYLTMTVRIIGIDESGKLNETKATLSLINATQIFCKMDIETYILTTLTAWNLDAEKVTGVVADVNQKYLVDACKGIFPSAGVTTCALYAFRKLQDIFESHVLRIMFVKTKVIDIHRIIVSSPAVLNHLTSEEKAMFIGSTLLHEKLFAIKTTVAKLSIIFCAEKIYDVIPPTLVDLDTIEKYHKVCETFYTEFTKNIEAYGNIPSSLFTVLKLYAASRIDKLLDPSALEFKGVRDKLREAVATFFQCANTKYLNVMTLLDPRVKDGNHMSREAKSAANRILEASLELDVFSPTQNQSSSPENACQEFYREIVANSNSIQAPSGFGRSITLSAYFDEKGPSFDSPGCLMELWKKKQEHPLFKLVEKFAPVLCVLFGPESVPARGAEDIRDLITFLRSAYSQQ